MTKQRPLLFLLVVGMIIAWGIFFWRHSSTVESDLTFATKLENLPAGLVIVGHPPEEVEVQVQGHKSAVQTFLGQRHICVLDLTGAVPGLFTVPVGESSLQLPGGISLVHMAPTSITLRIEPKQTKTVPVAVTLTDSPAPGYKVAMVLATPGSVDITGPEKSLSQISQLATRPVSIKDVSEPFKKEITLDLPDGVTIDKPGISLVVAQVTIEENIIVRQFKGIPVDARNTAFLSKITPPVIDIDVRGPENALSRLSVGQDIKAYVDLENLTQGVYVRRAQISLPVGTTLAGATPEVFTVTIGP